MQHRNTEYCRLPAIYMKETEESRERNSPEVYENGGRNTERYKYRNNVSPIADEEGISNVPGKKIQVGYNCWVLYSQSKIVSSVVCLRQAGSLNIERLFGYKLSTEIVDED